MFYLQAVRSNCLKDDGSADIVKGELLTLVEFRRKLSLKGIDVSVTFLQYREEATIGLFRLIYVKRSKIFFSCGKRFLLPDIELIYENGYWWKEKE